MLFGQKRRWAFQGLRLFMRTMSMFRKRRSQALRRPKHSGTIAPLPFDLIGDRSRTSRAPMRISSSIVAKCSRLDCSR